MSRRSHGMGHWRRQETLHFFWVTAGAGLPGKRGRGISEDQACGREQAAFLEPGS
jgi:hypothetical protein